MSASYHINTSKYSLQKMKKDLLTLRDLSSDDFDSLFIRSFELKKRLDLGITDQPLQGKPLQFSQR